MSHLVLVKTLSCHVLCSDRTYQYEANVLVMAYPHISSAMIQAGMLQTVEFSQLIK